MSLRKLLIPAFLSLALSGCSSFKTITYIDVKLESSASTRLSCAPDKDTIEKLIAKIWDSGFFKQIEKTKEEIVNNKYTIISRNDKENRCNPNQSCIFYEKKLYDNKKQKHNFHILIGEKLFCYLELNPSMEFGMKHQKPRLMSMSKNLEPNLLRNLFHDLWYNLLDTDEKMGFFVEGQIFYEKIVNTRTDGQKLDILKKMGYANPPLSSFDPFQGLKEKRENFDNCSGVNCQDTRYFENELYADIAQMAFENRIIIPHQLRKFYEGLISEKYLHKDKL